MRRLLAAVACGSILLSPSLGLAEEGPRPIRPGAPLSIREFEAGCTLNFIFRDTQGAFYIGTAGHCVQPGQLEVRVPAVGDIGDVVFQIPGGIPGRDFALIRIDPLLYGLVSPTTCAWGGPTQMYAFPSSPQEGRSEALVHYGWGQAYKHTAATRARAGVLPATGWGAERLHFLAPLAGGDSGSPLLTARGEAIGIIGATEGLPGEDPGQQHDLGTGPSDATRLDLALATAEAGLQVDLELVLSDHLGPGGVDDACAIG